METLQRVRRAFYRSKLRSATCPIEDRGEMVHHELFESVFIMISGVAFEPESNNLEVISK